MAFSPRCIRCIRVACAAPHCGGRFWSRPTPWGSFPTPWELFPIPCGIPSPHCGASVWGACFDHGHHGQRMRMDGWALSPNRTGKTLHLLLGDAHIPFLPQQGRTRAVALLGYAVVTQSTLRNPELS
jgi:hypothetical protein